MTTIAFYEPTEPYYEFSNFFCKNGRKKHQFELDNQVYVSVEQYFQAQKFYVPDSPEHMAYMGLIRAADSPTKVFMLGQQKAKGGYASKWVINKQNDGRLVNEIVRQYAHLSIRPDWEVVKINVMQRGLMAKFEQNRNLAELLLSTGTKKIVENSPRDDVWGIGKHGDGQNMLGKLLVDVRDHIMLM